MRTIRLLVGAAPLFLAAASGCGGGTAADTSPTSSTPVLTTLSVTLPSSALTVGQTETATATGLDQFGAAIGTGTITWTSSNTAVATVSSAGLVTAVSPGSATIMATSDGHTATGAVTVTPAGVTPPANITLSSAGQSSAFLTSPNFSGSLALQPGAQYLIAVVNTDPSYTTLESFTLAGSLGAGSADRVRAAPGAVAPRSSPPASRPNPSAQSAVVNPGPVENHLAILDDNRRIFARYRAAGLVRRPAAGRVAPSSAAISQAIGTVNKVYVKHALSGSCTAVDSIGGRTVAVGQHVIVLADTNQTTWPAAQRPDSSFYQTFANEYDAITWPHLLTYIGNPLAYDGSLSGVGKVTVTITPVLNNFAGAGGGSAVVAFVNGCDFFPLASGGPNADFSNQTEMFYSWVPGSDGYTVATWEEGLRATAAHESKHLVSYADRILNNSSSFEEVWLEEGLAQVSSEIWERNFSQATWKGHATFAQTIACELDLGASQPCDILNNKPRALIASHLPFFFTYLENESTSNSEGLGEDIFSDYGAGWTMSRWAIDQYASTESSFIPALIDEPTLTGLPNVSAHTGQPVPLLLVYWNVASAIFQTPSYVAADVRTTFPSFNFADIFKGGQTQLTCGSLPCGLFTSSGTPIYPVQPVALTTASFSKTVNSVPGTSASFFLLSAGSVSGTESLQLLSSSGSALSLSSGFRVAILRVQ